MIELGTSRWRRYAWLPLPVLLFVLIVFRTAGLTGAYTSPWLLVGVNLAIVTPAAFAVAFLMGRSFWLRGVPGLLWVGSGILIWGLGGLAACLAALWNYNAPPTIHNTALALSALCHLTGVVLALRADAAVHASWRGPIIAGAYGAALGAVATLAVAVLTGWFPVFFVQGQGGTPVRLVVLITASVLLGLTALLLRSGHRARESPFAEWYSLGLLLLAAHAVAVSLQSSVGSAVFWTGRVMEYLAGAYLLAASLAARDAQGWEISLADALRDSEDRLRFALETSHTGAWDLDLETHTAHRSLEHDRIFGYAEMLPQWTFEMFLDHVLPEDRPAVYARFREATRTQGDWDFECRIRRADGEIRWIWAVGRHRFDASGRARRIGGIVQDITERKQTEQALCKAAERSSLAQRAGFAGEWDWDIPSGRLTWSNELFSLFDLESCPQPSFDLWRSALHPEDREAAERRIEQAIQDRVPLSNEYRVVRRDGQVRWISALGQPTYDDSGRPLRMTGLCIDITKRKDVESALQQSEERLRMATAAARLFAFDWDPISDHVRREGDSAGILGVQVQEETGASFFARIHPDDRARFTEMVKSLHRGRDSYTVTYRVLRPDGDEAVLEESGRALFDEQGRFVRLTGMAADITQRKRAEEALREQQRQLALAMEAGQLVPWEINLITGEVKHSPQLFELFGLDPHDEFQSREQWRTLIHEEDRPKIFQSVEAAKTGKEHHIEYRIRHPDGTIHWHESHGTPVADENGRQIRLVGYALDITDRKRAEAELDAARIRAEEARAIAESATRAKDQFIAVLSHELRTPLTPAVAALALLRKNVRLPSDVREDLEVVSNNIDLEVRLIADLLDVSRIISGKLHLEKRTVDIADAIREAAKIVSGDLDAKGQALAIETPGAPYLIFGDAARLQQVFWNLLRNSIKFSPTRSRIVIRAAFTPTAQCPPAEPCPAGREECPLPPGATGTGQACIGNLIVEVIDKGSGIASEMLPRLFNAFEQEEKARSFGGLGLGLSICKTVVEMHGGSISAHSDGIGCGTTIRLRLPAARCPLTPGSEPGRTEADTAAGGSPPGGRHPLRVLLVEDHPDTAKLMRRLLMVEGHEVTVAGSVAEGLAAVRGQKPDLLISDLGLPDGTGLDLIRQLLSEGNGIPAIALSGYGTPADMEKSRAAGFAEHLVKPLSSVDALTDAIARIGVGGGSQENGAVNTRTKEPPPSNRPRHAGSSADGLD